MEGGRLADSSSWCTFHFEPTGEQADSLSAAGGDGGTRDGTSLFGPGRQDSRDSVSDLLDELTTHGPGTPANRATSPGTTSRGRPAGSSGGGSMDYGISPQLAPLHLPPHSPPLTLPVCGTSPAPRAGPSRSS